MGSYTDMAAGHASAQASKFVFSDPRIVIGGSVIEHRHDELSLRETAEYETLEDHIRRLEAEGPAAVDWDEVARLSTVLIETRGKDLVAGCWLAYALFRRERYRGLAVGLGILREMLASHWETMQPPVSRVKARVGALEWLSSRAASLCEAEPTEEERAAVLFAFAALGEIEQEMHGRLAGQAPSLHELTRALAPQRDAVRRALAEAERAREEEAAQARLPVPAPAAAVPQAPALDRAALDALPETLRTLAAALLATDPTDGRAYALARVASWWRIRQVPPNEGGRTTAMPPVEEAAAIHSWRRDGQTVPALLALNDLVWTAPFWFEGHRLAAEILRGAGAAYAEAHAAVCGAMPLLFRRLPQLMTFSFADGSPLVDADTRAWLAECGGDPSGRDDGLARLHADVKHLLAAGKGKEAMERVAALTQEGGSGRDRLLRQIAQAQFCLDVGLIAAALPLLDHLDQLLEAHGLESFEPALAAQVAELRFRALTHADAFKLVPEERRRHGLDLTRQRLVRLDFATAARLFR